MSSYLNDWIISGISATVSKTIVAPIERIKLILQIQEGSLQIIATKTPYKGILDCILRLPKEQGYLSLWRGNFINVCRYFPTQAFNFAFNSNLKGFILRNTNRKTHFGQYLVRNCVCGGLAGGLSHCIVYPLNMCYTKVASDIGNTSTIKREYTGLINCMTETSRLDGFKGFYRGFYAGLIGVIVYRSMYFGFYDTAKMSLEDIYVQSRIPFYVSWSVAQVVTCSAGFVSYPLDTLGRRMMLQTTTLNSANVKYQNTLQCLQSIIHKQGILSLYRGGLTNVIRSTCGALVLVFYDELKYQTLTPELRKNEIFTTERYHQFWRKRFPPI